MKLRLTKAQMLAQWKLRHHLEPLRTDSVSVRSRGLSLDAYCEAEMRSRYVAMLAEADTEYLTIQNVAIKCTLQARSNGSATIELPEGVVRVTGIRLVGWRRSAIVVTDPNDPRWRRQANRFSAGGVEQPVALWDGGSRIEVFSLNITKALPMLLQVDAVIDEGEDVYTFDERAWELLTAG